MSAWGVLLLLALAEGPGHALHPVELPTCPNRVINEVVRRSGCTLGDARCWLSAGGFCNDYVERRLWAGHPASGATLVAVGPESVRRGDVAVFLSRAHYAFVERVIVGPAGRPVAVDVSEHNYGTCWVDADLLVTNNYKLMTRRTGIATGDVDGGFLRLAPGTGEGARPRVVRGPEGPVPE